MARVKRTIGEETVPRCVGDSSPLQQPPKSGEPDRQGEQSEVGGDCRRDDEPGLGTGESTRFFSVVGPMLTHLASIGCNLPVESRSSALDDHP